MKIVIDTNVIFADRILNGPEFEMFERYLKKEKATLVVPEVVVEEAVGSYRRQLEEKVQSAKQALDKLHGFISSSNRGLLPQVSVGSETAAYQKKLISRLKSLGAAQPHYEGIPHTKLVAKAIARQKPFSEHGQGYRDSLIWEAVVEAARSTEMVIFITKNSSDFAGESGNLHKDLKEDLSNSGIDPGRVRIIPGLVAFNKEFAEPLLESVEVDSSSSSEDSEEPEPGEIINQESAKGFIQENLAELRVKADDMIMSVVLPKAVGAAVLEVRSIDTPSLVEFKESRQLESDLFFVRIVASCPSRLLVAVRRSRFYRQLRKLKPMLEDDAFSYSLVSLVMEKALVLSISMVWQLSTASVLKYQLESVKVTWE